MPTLRQASVDDIPAMWALRTRAVRAGCVSHYAPEVIDAWCAAPLPERMPSLIEAGGGLLTEVAGEIVAYAILDVANGEVDALFVEPAHQGRGLARQLMTALEAMATQRHIERLFLSASLNAVPFYRAAGFQVIREELYPHRSGLLLASRYMEKHLATQGGATVRDERPRRC